MSTPGTGAFIARLTPIGIDAAGAAAHRAHQVCGATVPVPGPHEPASLHESGEGRGKISPPADDPLRPQSHADPDRRAQAGLDGPAITLPQVAESLKDPRVEDRGGADAMRLRSPDRSGPRDLGARRRRSGSRREPRQRQAGGRETPVPAWNRLFVHCPSRRSPIDRGGCRWLHMPAQHRDKDTHQRHYEHEVAGPWRASSRAMTADGAVPPSFPRARLNAHPRVPGPRGRPGRRRVSLSVPTSDPGQGRSGSRT